MSLEQQANQYILTVERLLGKGDGNNIKEFRGQFDKAAFGDREIFELLVPLAEKESNITVESERRNARLSNGTKEARSKATNAYAIAGADNAGKVNKLINIALKYCSASDDTVKAVAENIDRILVSGNGKLRTLEEVREISLAVAQRGSASVADILG